MCAVSIALWDNGLPIVGVVHNIFSNQVFFSCKGGGAWLNNKSIISSSKIKKEESVLATGFPSGRNYSTESLGKFIEDIQDYKKIRMLGSASLMLAYVSGGYFDAYKEEDIYIWDVAAGLSLISESGGFYKIKPGSNEFKFNVYAKG
jgi:myo-inositol-1(or 4)-monophosphatase